MPYLYRLDASVIYLTHIVKYICIRCDMLYTDTRTKLCMQYVVQCITYGMNQIPSVAVYVENCLI